MKELLALAMDDEFTTFDKIAGDLIEIAFVEVFTDLTKGRKFKTYLKPRSEKYFTEKAQEIHGISYFKALAFPERRAALIDLMQWLEPLISQFPLKTIYWGSNNFDLKWLEITMEDEGFKSQFDKAFSNIKDDHINAYYMAKKLLKLVPKIPGETGDKGRYKLNNVAKFYNIDFNHHSALDDADTTADIYINMRNGKDVWTGQLL